MHHHLPARGLGLVHPKGVWGRGLWRQRLANGEGWLSPGAKAAGLCQILPQDGHHQLKLHLTPDCTCPRPPHLHQGMQRLKVGTEASDSMDQSQLGCHANANMQRWFKVGSSACWDLLKCRAGELAGTLAGHLGAEHLLSWTRTCTCVHSWHV